MRKALLIIATIATALGAVESWAAPVITIPRIEKGPALDGKITPAGWSAAQHLSPFVVVGGRAMPTLQTDVMLQYDGKALYIAAYLMDPQPDKLKAETAERDGPVYADDSLELFFDTEGKRQNYAHLAVNPRNVQFDEMNHDKAENFQWESKTSITNDGWKVEIALPFAGGIAPQPGEGWNITVCRNAARVREISSWALHAQTFHEPESFGVLVFGTAPVRCLIDDLGKRWFGTNTARMSLANPAKSKVAFKLNAKVTGTDRRGDTFAAQAVTLVGHEKKDPPAPYKIVQDGLGSLTFSLTDATGKAFYRTASYPVSLPAVSPHIEASERALSGCLSGWAALPKSGIKDTLQVELDALSETWKTIVAKYRGREAMTADDLTALQTDAAKLEVEAIRLQRKMDTARGTGGAPGDFGIGALPVTRNVMSDDLDIPIGKPARLEACRNEWRSVQLALLPFDKAVPGVTVTCGDLVGEKPETKIPSSEVSVRLADFVPAVKPGDTTATVRQWPDVLRESAQSFELPARTTRAVWLTVHVPEKTPPGVYRGSISAKTAAGAGSELLLEVAVHSPVIPSPDSYRLGVDFWQDTNSLAMQYKVDRWSPAWWGLVEAYLKDMAAHGEDVIQVDRSFFDWTKAADGTFTFSYDRFDKYVELCLRLGIRRHIEYLQMFNGRGPSEVWFVGADGAAQKVVANPGEDGFNVPWLAFAKDFATHLKARGWWDMLWVCPTDEPQDIYGEPTLDRFKRCCGLLKAADPNYKTTVALDSLASAKDLAQSVDRFVFKLRDDVYNRPFAQSLLGQGKRVETYICCHPDRPNSFVTSDAIEQPVIGWLCYREDFAGLLRWSYMNWPPDVFKKPDGDGSLPPGDMFVVYPGDKAPLSSTRWERLREGFEDYELLRQLHDAVGAAWKSGRSKQAVAAEQTLNDALAAVCGPHLGVLTQFTTDPEVYALSRLKVLKALDDLAPETK